MVLNLTINTPLMVEGNGVLLLILLFYFQHHRVRFAACNAIGQLANDFAPTFQKKFHAKVTRGPLVVSRIPLCN